MYKLLVNTKEQLSPAQFKILSYTAGKNTASLSEQVITLTYRLVIKAPLSA